VGNLAGRRRLVDAAAAFLAHAACDERAEVEKEAYLSAFRFGDDFRSHLGRTGSSRDFDGPCWSPHVWWDLDRPGDLERATTDARRLATSLLDRYRSLDDDDLLLFFSGCKGFQVGLPAFWSPGPAVDFHRVARRFASRLAGDAGAGAIDRQIYAKVQPLRAPNSRHPRSRLFKRRLRLDELMGLSIDGIRHLARRPEPFDLPEPRSSPADRAKAEDDWTEAVRSVERDADEGTARFAAITDGNRDGTPRLNARTLRFLREGALEGDRATGLFQAAANLAEFGCPPALAHALLTEVALDSGLTPGETRRQIECGLAHPMKVKTR
jgi:hypothetical protein